MVTINSALLAGTGLTVSVLSVSGNPESEVTNVLIGAIWCEDRRLLGPIFLFLFHSHIQFDRIEAHYF
jgi:hypothetical protein